jgi:hypothetical protein
MRRVEEVARQLQGEEPPSNATIVQLDQQAVAD